MSRRDDSRAPNTLPNGGSRGCHLGTPHHVGERGLDLGSERIDGDESTALMEMRITGARRSIL